jgi:hypothetical protein
VVRKHVPERKPAFAGIEVAVVVITDKPVDAQTINDLPAQPDGARRVLAADVPCAIGAAEEYAPAKSSRVRFTTLRADEPILGIPFHKMAAQSRPNCEVSVVPEPCASNGTGVTGTFLPDEPFVGAQCSENLR